MSRTPDTMPRLAVQQDLFDPAPEAPLPSNYTDTSRAAAQRAKAKAPTDRATILAYIRRRGVLGSTVDEVETALGLSHQTASARVNQLRNDGWVKDSGGRRPTRTGTKAIVWVEGDGHGEARR